MKNQKQVDYDGLNKIRLLSTLKMRKKKSSDTVCSANTLNTIQTSKTDASDCKTSSSPSKSGTKGKKIAPKANQQSVFIKEEEELIDGLEEHDSFMSERSMLAKHNTKDNAIKRHFDRQAEWQVTQLNLLRKRKPEERTLMQRQQD